MAAAPPPDPGRDPAAEPLRSDAPVPNSRASLRSDARVPNSRASLRSDAPVPNSRASLRSDAPASARAMNTLVLAALLASIGLVAAAAAPAVMRAAGFGSPATVAMAPPPSF